MKLKNLLYALLIIALGGFIAYRVVSNKSKDDESKKFGDKNAVTTVTGIVIKTEIFDNNLSLSGSIEANEQVEIHSEVSGIVEGIYFQEGSNVNKGQVLFKVNDIELKAQLQQAATKEELNYYFKKKLSAKKSLTSQEQIMLQLKRKRN